ncbi:MAG: MarR family transcriptional regulator [Candidatus Riflebacteria bacterium]|nr:MarR family transcriptional regulator [Candidatus Riflebacteria bacterium]
MFNLFQEKNAIPLKDLVSKTRRVKSTVTAVVRNLERHGYLSRESCPSDGRVVLVKLTPRGREIRGDFENISELLLQKLYTGISESDRNSLFELLTRLENNLLRR